jgi:ribosomal protein S18 acetylase RimI-like enzyme
MDDRVLVRPMTHEDVEPAYRCDSLALAADADEKERVLSRPPQEVARRQARYHHLIDTDPQGAWVAVEGERTVGSALALRREGVWILSLLAIDADYRGVGLGRRLLQKALSYAEGCSGAITASSTNPAAIRLYASAGFSLRPTLKASGAVRREALPSSVPVREGTVADLGQVAEVDRCVRGAAHGPDIDQLLSAGGRLLVAEPSAQLGYAIVRKDGSPWLLAATHPAIAEDLLWACLCGVPDDGDVTVRWLDARQQWAIPIVLAARLKLEPAGPLCTKGHLGPLTPYLPNNAYL